MLILIIRHKRGKNPKSAKLLLTIIAIESIMRNIIDY
jgi:hypothetical protein